MPIAQDKKIINTKTAIKVPNFKYGVVWEDPINGHRIGCFDVSKKEDVEKLMQNEKAILAIQDPPYNVDINDEFGNLPLDQYIKRNKPVSIRNFITMRNQRGYGTQKNWMAIRQELLYYIKGEPIFNVQAEYTDIPKKTKGYYKEVK